MGTSKGYGGSAGAKPVRDPIREWISGTGSGGEGGDGGDGGEDQPRLPPPDDDQPGVSRYPAVPPQVLRSLAALGGLFAAAAAGERSGARGGGRVAGGRDTSKAARSGGLAASAGYGLRGGADQQQAFADHTLQPADLEGLGPMEQAFRIKEAAAPDGEQLADDEINQANCNFAMWIVDQGPGIAPEVVVRRWIVEYVWVVWQREVGNDLNGLDARQRQRREEQMKAVLENRMAIADIDLEGVTPADFQQAIQEALETLEAIFGTEQR